MSLGRKSANKLNISLLYCCSRREAATMSGTAINLTVSVVEFSSASSAA